MLLEMLSQQLQGDTVKQMSRQLGADEQQVGTAITAALPLLLGALARNTSQSQGARSLANAVDRDHDGSILENLSGFLSNAETGPGAGILRHVLGGGQPAVESALSRTSGLDGNSTGQLLKMLAPVVMGMIGQTKRSRNLGAEDLAGMLQDEGNRVKASPAGGLMSLLDSDGDGSVIDDVGNLLGRFLK